MRQIFTFLFLLVFSLLNAQNYCAPGRFTQTAFFDSSDIRKDSNIVFAVSKNYYSGAMEQLKMDVYYADASADTMQQRPFILLIHGGAFMAGSRFDMNYQCMEYARRGFVVGTIDYRMGWTCQAADLIGVCLFCQGLYANVKTATYEAAQDARAALRYINVNAANWNANPNCIFIGGESAGSITSYHAAFWDQAEANAFAPAAVNQVGTLDTAGNSLPSNWSIKGLIDNCGAITKDSALLNNGNIPVISFHDDADIVVPYAYGQVMCSNSSFYWVAGSSPVHTLLVNNGICSELNTVPNSINHCSYPATMIVKRASCFMKRVLCGACVSGTNNNIWAIDSCDMVTGVTELGMREQRLTAVPNPSNAFCDLHFSEPSRTGGSVLLMNSMGQLVMEQQFPALTTSISLNTQNLPEGVYFAVIKGSGAGACKIAVAH
jgi:hypothetical protein